jgi:hypothetical protein
MDINDVRPEVIKMAIEMEVRLRANESRGGWAKESQEYLCMCLVRETAELMETLFYGGGRLATRKAANVANYAMMISDNWGS